MPHCSNCGGSLENAVIADSRKTPFTGNIAELVKEEDISNYDSLSFISADNSVYTVKRASILRLVSLIVQKMGKTSFEPNELLSMYEESLEQIKSDLPKAEFERIAGRIHSWIEQGGKIEFKKK